MESFTYLELDGPITKRAYSWQGGGRAYSWNILSVYRLMGL